MSDYKEQVNSLREHADLIETSIELYGPSATRLLVYDLRNAAAAIEELKAIAHSHCVAASSYWEELEELKAQLPKRGKWLNVTDSYSWYGKCSVCGEEFVVDAYYAGGMNYCPNCGAKMTGEQDVE